MGQIVRLFLGAHLDMVCIDLCGFLVLIAQESLKLIEPDVQN